MPLFPHNVLVFDDRSVLG